MTLEGIQQAYRAHDQFVVEFTQDTYQALVNRTVHFTGTVSYRRDAGVRMEVTSPERQLIILRGDTVWIELLDQGTCSVQEIPPEFASQNILAFFSGLGTLTGDYLVEEKQDHLALTPRGGVGSIAIWVDKSHLLKRIQLTDATGNHSEMRLYSYAFNVSLPATLFTPRTCDNGVDMRVNTP